MSDRDRFAGLTFQWLDNAELNVQDKQFVVDYLLRLLRRQKIEINSLPDVVEWNFTGDNVIFNTIQLLLNPGYLSVDYSWEQIGSIADTTSDIFTSCVTDDTYVYIGSSSSIYDYVVYRYTISTGVFEGIIAPSDLDDGGGNARVSGMALDSSNNLYIVSQDSSGIWKWDGSSVSQLAATITGGYAIGIEGNNAYVAYGSTFWHYNLSTTTVTDIGTASGGSVTEDIAFDSSNNVYWVGNWTGIDAVTVNRVAKYTGGAAGSWSALGGGFSAACSSVICDGNDNVWVGNGINNAELNKWNGHVWTSYDLVGASGTIYDLGYSSSTGLICVGGNFSDTAEMAFRFRDGVAEQIGGTDLPGNFAYGVCITTDGDIYMAGDYIKGTVGPMYFFEYYDGSDILPFAPQDSTLLSTDSTMIADSDVLYPSQSAVRDYASRFSANTSDPTTTDDVTGDYLVGHMWLNTNG